MTGWMVAPWFGRLHDRRHFCLCQPGQELGLSSVQQMWQAAALPVQWTVWRPAAPLAGSERMGPADGPLHPKPKPRPAKAPVLTALCRPVPPAQPQQPVEPQYADPAAAMADSVEVFPARARARETRGERRRGAGPAPARHSARRSPHHPPHKRRRRGAAPPRAQPSAASAVPATEGRLQALRLPLLRPRRLCSSEAEGAPASNPWIEVGSARNGAAPKDRSADPKQSSTART